jgi:hypothetical protein
MPIAQWLEKLGMSEYIQRFAEHNVDVSVLSDLSDQDLKELGISIGHRRKILAAIRELPGIAPAATEAATVVPDVQNAAECRQLTVLFSDLVGSTELSGRMDPEELRELISAYNRCVAETVRRFGGFVAKFMGDGVLVYFGYGLRLLDECLDRHEGAWVAEVLRLKGWVLIRQGRHTAAKEQLLDSIAWAPRQQTRSWELRSSTTLAKLLIACDDRGAARQLLAPVFDWFTEGSDTPDLKAARALLAD